MKLSKFGIKFTTQSGILRLMDDLGRALSGSRQMLMLGGGNPAHIPEVQELFRARMKRILDQPGAFERLVGNYDAPQGEEAFINALAVLLKRELGWQVGPKNIALTSGSQSAFFLLFNMFAGEFSDGSQRRVLLPLAPEYIGYADLGLEQDFFRAARPNIELIDEHTFKYHVDFDALEIDESIGLMCVSRPTNPTGNVLTDAEMERLVAISRARDIPLIIDNAYGTPFPDIIFTEATPIWNEHVIVCMSLSKLGLPGTRTGIVIASEEIIEALAGMNAILNLATGSLGAALALDLVASGDVLKVSRETIMPYYRERAEEAVARLHAGLDGCDYLIHKAEGAFFLWLWFRNLPITSEELYERLKQRGVVVVSGHYFFPGLQEDWRHRHECIRVNYSQHPDVVREGLGIIAEEVKKAYAEG